MDNDTKIALDCPYCGDMIHAPLAWFKKPYSTCPSCDKGLSGDQFAAVIYDLEQAFDRNIDEMLTEPVKGGCCGSNKKKDSCCGNHN